MRKWHTLTTAVRREFFLTATSLFTLGADMDAPIPHPFGGGGGCGSKKWQGRRVGEVAESFVRVGAEGWQKKYPRGVCSEEVNFFEKLGKNVIFSEIFEKSSTFSGGGGAGWVLRVAQKSGKLSN